MDFPDSHLVVRRYPLLSVVVEESGITTRSCFKTSLGLLILPSLVCLGVYLDGTWNMGNAGKGLVQHYGFWAQCITTPIIAILTGATLNCFLSTMHSLEKYSTSGELPRDLRRMINKEILSISLRRRSRFLLYLMMVTGLCFGILNVRQTMDPKAIYGNEVYDSISHTFGFVLTKPFLFFNWALVYPIAIFLIVHVTISMVRIRNYMCSNELLRIDFFHPDNCGGVSVFGDINTYIMGVYINFFAVLIALDLTHERKYETLVLFASLASIGFIFQSVGVVYSIRRFVQEKKREYLEVINKKLDSQVRAAIPAGSLADLLIVRNHVLSLKSHPYTRQASVIVNAIRFAPVAIVALKLINERPL